MEKRMDSEQQRLPFEKPLAGVVAIRSIDCRASPWSEHRWAQVREVVIAIALCSSRDGQCQARNEKLRSIANDNRSHGAPPIASARTFRRCLQESVDAGLVLSTTRYQKSALREVVWGVVRSMVEASRKLARSVTNSSGHSMATVWPTTGQPLATLYQYQPTQPKGSTAPERADEATKENYSGEAIEAARQVCHRVVRKLRLQSPLTDRDRELIAKVALLSLRWGEHWLHDAVEGCVLKCPKKPLAYLHASLNEKCRAKGSTLNRELASCRVPAELLSRPEPDDLSERLCGREEVVL